VTVRREHEANAQRQESGAFLVAMVVVELAELAERIKRR
jgi:hypothetical protein